MSWPWVSRAQHEELKDTLKLERIRYAGLLYDYTKLRRSGASPPLPEPEPIAPLPERKVDELRLMIHEISGKDLRKRALMLKQLKADREAGISDERIEQAIEHGVSSDGLPG